MIDLWSAIIHQVSVRAFDLCGWTVFENVCSESAKFLIRLRTFEWKNTLIYRWLKSNETSARLKILNNVLSIFIKLISKTPTFLTYRLFLIPKCAVPRRLPDQIFSRFYFSPFFNNPNWHIDKSCDIFVVEDGPLIEQSKTWLILLLVNGPRLSSLGSLYFFPHPFPPPPEW